jgi:nitrogen fixation protein FixH
MKKIIFFVLVFFAMVVAVYILIPAVIKVSAAGYLQTNSRIASNYLTDNQQWRLWWPSKKGDGNQFEYNGYYFF